MLHFYNYIAMKSSPAKNHIGSIEGLSEQNLKQLSQKNYKGCGHIFHRIGYMNSKGDAPYDFTCDSSHRCQPCEENYSKIIGKLNQIQEKRLLLENTKSVESKLELIKSKYFKPKNGCSCEQKVMCKECFEVLQKEVTRLESGCGKQWEEQFGGMAAGPAYVTCYQNYFLCSSCSEELAFINKVNKQYPHVQLKHIPEGEKEYWSGPRQKPYYSGLL